MSAALSVYRLCMQGLSPFAPTLLRHRLKTGKELPGRLNERWAKNLAPRPEGTLIWMHGASIGESKLLLGIANAILTKRADVTFIFTSQTASSAGILGANLPEGSLHQMAPIDTKAATARFVQHWRPDLCVFAEGEIWPNLLAMTKQSGAPLALINARMTEKSLAAWQRFADSASVVFGHFDLVLAADEQTASGLSQITGREVSCMGNLKTAFAARHAAPETANSEAIFPGASGPILLGASTHDGEETLLLEALEELPATTRLILAPRHPKRADTIAEELNKRQISFIMRSTGDKASPETRVLLADTFGEMDLWFDAADIVYLGGGHKPGIGGHNPLEPLAFGKPIITGPFTHNFADIYADLDNISGISVAQTSIEIAALASHPSTVDMAALKSYTKTADLALNETLDALLALLGNAAKR